MDKLDKIMVKMFTSIVNNRGWSKGSKDYEDIKREILKYYEPKKKRR